MAQNQKNNSGGMYKKIKRAVSINPFQASNKPISPDHVHFSAAAKANKPDKESDHRFTDYIRKMKDKMRAPSSVGITHHHTAAKGVPKTTRRDSFNDKVSGYINRAKMKIRTTSIAGEDK